jgi:bifunctional pyridoxal-dependent enzyme with beta-cystathionase and maltose regulon repressor activities
MVHVLGSMDDKHCFNSVSFWTNKVHNCLKQNLQLVVMMYTQKFFTLDYFMYQATYEM